MTRKQPNEKVVDPPEWTFDMKPARTPGGFDGAPLLLRYKLRCRSACEDSVHQSSQKQRGKYYLLPQCLGLSDSSKLERRPTALRPILLTTVPLGEL